MTMDEAVGHIWSWWRLQCGALTRDEVELLSRERTLLLLREFGNLEAADLDFAGLQARARAAVDGSESLDPMLERIRDIEATLQSGRARIAAARAMTTDWVREPGVQLQRCLPMPRPVRLSPPLRELLISIVDQSISKAHAIAEALQRYAAASPAFGDREEGEGAPEIPIDGERVETHSWRMLIESFDDDHVGSMRIASYGDSRSSNELPISPVFLLDDY
jgi:hypothetical protein